MTAFSLLLLAALQQPAPAAAARLPVGTADTSPFRRLALPAPTLLREGSGLPGPRYWQQRADYGIRASLDTATHTITGHETIRYTNNSPDTLRYLWLQVDQNIYRTDSRGAAINPTDARFAGAGFV
ncbi:MAG: peptidase M1, partial [Gemmatimonadetes bacterium]